MKYSIKITGSGTTDEIINALKNVIENIEEVSKSASEIIALDGAEWEDGTLMTEIESE